MAVYVVAALILLAIPLALMVLTYALTERHAAEAERREEQWTAILAEQEARHQKERQAWVVERSSLLERIQRPEFMPPAPVEGPPIPDNSIKDELHLVGQVIEPSDQPA